MLALTYSFSSRYLADLVSGGLYIWRLVWHLNGFNLQGWPEASKMSVSNTTAVFFRKEVGFSVLAGYNVLLYQVGPTPPPAAAREYFL